MSLTAISSLEYARRKFFMNSTYIMSTKQDQTFLRSGGQNESNSQQLARIGEKKIFHELHVHHVQKVGIKRFWGHEVQMSITANSSRESARRKFLMKSAYIMSRKQESNVFVLRRPNESKSQQLARIGEKKIFHELVVHHVQKVGIKRFWAHDAEMRLTAISLFQSASEKFYMNSTQKMCKNSESNDSGLRRPI